MAGASAPSVVERSDLGAVWSGQPVNFALVTHQRRQFVAFYDAERYLTVAARELGSALWTRAKLDTVLGWDSHNHVAMAVDSSGRIHVSGNMHGVPLIYFRTTRPLDVTSFTRVASMVGRDEARCTYPEFFHGPAAKLCFSYRDGESGNGNHVFNDYDAASQTWARLHAGPLTDGRGAQNAYPVGPVRGPDDWFHLVWVWRDSPDAASNHDLCYARSRDLVSWHGGDGRVLKLPLTLEGSDVVDPVPAGAGLINNNTKLGFDAQGRPIVSYQKHDERGYTQICNARLENGQWVRYVSTDFTYRWVFGGVGTLVFELEFEAVRVLDDGSLVQDFYHAKYGGRGTLCLNPTTLRAERIVPALLPHPAELDAPESSGTGMIVRWTKDSGQSPDATIRYMLRWETLAANRDQPRDHAAPSSNLAVYGFRLG